MPDAPVGRETEFSSIVELLDRRAGLPAGIRLVGEAGIGKTTLLTLSLEVARERGLTVLSTRPGPAEAAPAYVGLRDLLEAVIDRAVPTLSGPEARALLAAVLLTDPAPEPPDQAAIGFAALQVLRFLAKERPVLIAVDDLQWLDAATAWVLAFCIRRLRDEDVRIVATIRADPAGGRGWLGDALRDRLADIALGPLSFGAVERVLLTRLGTTFPRPALRRIHELSGGNPFYAIEIGRMLERRGGRIDLGAPLPVPPDLDELVGERIEQMPPATLEALAFAAAMSAPTIDVLEAALAGPPLLQPAIDASILETSGRQLRFSHPLIAVSIFDRAGPARRLAVHRRLAEVIADPEERARHLALGFVEPDREVAAALESAAQAARRRGAPSASADLLEHAVRLSDPLDPARIRRAIDAADAHFEAGDTVRARELLEGLAAARPVGLERARVLWRLAAVAGELDTASESVVRYREALREAAGDEELAARIHSELAWMTVFTADLATAIIDAREAVRLADRVGVTEVLADALAALAFVGTLAGLPESADVLARALEVERGSDRLRLDRCPSVVQGYRLTWSGQLDAARPIFERLLQSALDRGDESNASAPAFWLATLEVQAGHWDRAASLLDDASVLATQTGVNRTEVDTTVALLAAHRGDVDQAIAAAERGAARAETTEERIYGLRSLAVLGFIHLSTDEPLLAHGYLARAKALADSIGIGEPGLLRFALDDADALIALGRLEDAEAEVDWVETRAVTLGRGWVLACASRSRGLLTAASGDLHQATSLIEEAVRLQQDGPMPFELARSRLVLGQVQRRGKQWRAARDSISRALEVFEGLGAGLWAARAKAELHRIGGRPASGDVLTPTERRVAEMVADGMSNGEVAAELFVTVRTVEANLSRVYAKLGIGSRGQLARKLVAITPREERGSG